MYVAAKPSMDCQMRSQSASSPWIGGSVVRFSGHGAHMPGGRRTVSFLTAGRGELHARWPFQNRVAKELGSRSSILTARALRGGSVSVEAGLERRLVGCVSGELGRVGRLNYRCLLPGRFESASRRVTTEIAAGKTRWTRTLRADASCHQFGMPSSYKFAISSPDSGSL